MSYLTTTLQLLRKTWTYLLSVPVSCSPLHPSWPWPLAAPYLCSHLAQCPPLSLHRHPARCDVYLTSLSPSPRLCLISAASLPEQRVLSPCFLNFRCIYSVRRCSGHLGYTGERNQQRSLPLWGLHSSRGTQTRRLNK